MSGARERAIEGRTDLSRFVIHLTRDDTEDFDEGQSARENFKGIVSDRKVVAFRPHCLHAKRIPKAVRQQYSVCCFTEVPLTELHLLTRPIQGRDVRLSDYGFVFSREFLVSKGAQPAIYINSYGGETWTREAADTIYEMAKRKRFRGGKLRRLLPYLNAMHERYDFTWEREWRVVGDLAFAPADVVCVILPEDGEEELKRVFLKYGVPVISPGWSVERIVSEFSDQARRARRLWERKKQPRSNPKREKGT